VPRNCHRLALKAPARVARPYTRSPWTGPRAIPPLASGSRPASPRVDAVAEDRVLCDQRWRAKGGSKDGGKKDRWYGNAKHTFITVKDENVCQGERLHLIIARTCWTQRGQFFMSNAPPQTGMAPCCWSLFRRWRWNGVLEDDKSEIGLGSVRGPALPWPDTALDSVGDQLPSSWPACGRNGGKTRV